MSDFPFNPLRAIVCVLALLALIAFAAFLEHVRKVAAVISLGYVAAGAALLLLAGCMTGCASTGVAATVGNAQAALAAAHMTVDAYCALAPEGRAEIRDRLNLPHLIACPNDPVPGVAPVGNPGWREPHDGRSLT